MANADGVFIDTNVWVHAAVPSAPMRQAALESLRGIAAGRLWTSRQVLREFLAVMSRPQTFFPGEVPMDELLRRTDAIESRCLMAEDGPTVTAQLRALLAAGNTRGKQVHDANITATMLANGLRVLLTENVSDFARWSHLIEVRTLAG